MGKKIMILVSYSRIPREEIYKMEISVDAVSVGKEEPIRRVQRPASTMGEILTDLHRILSVHPGATVTMLREETRAPFFGERPSRAFELDDKMRDLIRDDLETAKRAFAPVYQTVDLRKETKE